MRDARPAEAPPVHHGVDELSDFTTSDRRMLFLAALAVVIGVVGALVAAALYDLIGFFTNLFYFGRLSFTAVAPANSWGLLTIGVPVVGGIVIGFMARYGSERIRGHGIPEALESILINRSKIEPKVTVLKPVSSAVSIGTGGPFGAEGPIIMTGGAFGSVFAQFIRLSAGERKTLLVAGAAAGMAAIFNTPIAATLIAVELLLFEWKPRSLVPVGVASATAALLSWYLVPAHGFGPLFPIPSTASPTGEILLAAVAVGVAAGALSTLLTYLVYYFEDRFRKLPIHWMWWPAIGGVVVGVGGLLSVSALGVGYGSICELLVCTNTKLLLTSPVVQVTLVFVVTLLIVKAIIWAVALGSGTSGGVLAPLLLMGGSLGVIEAHFLPFGSVTLWVLVSMAATLGGTMRAPFTAVIFALELTHDVNALLPLFVAALLADAFTVLSMKRSILTEKVARRGVHVAREYSVDPLEQVPIRSVMHTDVMDVPAEVPIQDLVVAVTNPESMNTGLRLLNDDGTTAGFTSKADVRRFLDLGGDPGLPVRTQAYPTSVIGYPDEPLRIGASRLGLSAGLTLPVVTPEEPGRVIGFITRDDLYEARRIFLSEDQDRERVYTLPSYVTFFERFRRPPPPPPPPSP
ncbi:MAG: chloride channel protein [Thermoplasmata archaeon]